MGTGLALKEYLNYLKYPIYNYKRDAPLSLGMIINLYFIVFLFEMLLLIPVSAFSGMEDIPHAMEGLMEDMAFWQIFGLAVIMAPLFEEIIFRGHLRYRPLLFLFGLIVIVGTLGLVFGWWPSLSAGSGMEEGIAKMTGALTVILPLFVLLIMGYLVSDKLKDWVHRISVTEFSTLFYFTAVIFAVVHIFNFELEQTKWYLIPLLVMPQFILALYLGYIRVRNGIKYSIFVHALNNCIPLILFKIGTIYGPG